MSDVLMNNEHVQERKCTWSSVYNGGTRPDADQRKQRQNFKRKTEGKNLIEKRKAKNQSKNGRQKIAHAAYAKNCI